MVKDVSVVGIISNNSGDGEAPRDTGAFIKRRYVMTFLVWWGLVVCTTTRVSFSVAVVAMSAEYGWDKQTQGLLLACLYWGYMISSVPLGWCARRFGGRIVFCGGLATASLIVTLTPLFASNFAVLMLSRIVMGFVTGGTYPTQMHIMSKWGPPQQRSGMIAATLAGSQLGVMTSMGLTPRLISTWGWPAPFYVYGAHGLFWAAVFTWWASDEPETCHRISSQECTYILYYNNLGTRAAEKSSSVNVTIADSGATPRSKVVNGDESMPLLLPVGGDTPRSGEYGPGNELFVASTDVTTTTQQRNAKQQSLSAPQSPLTPSAANTTTTTSPPFRSIDVLRYSAVWAVIVSNFSGNYIAYIALSWLPTYFHDEMGLTLAHSGVFAMLPYIAQFFMGLLSGKAANTIISMRVFSLLNIRRTFQLTAMFVSALTLLLLVYIADYATQAVILFTVCIGVLPLQTPGYVANVADIAPLHAGVVMGFSNAIGTLPGAVAVYLVGYIVDRTHSWDVVFLHAAAINITSGILYWVFAQAKRVV